MVEAAKRYFAGMQPKESHIPRQNSDNHTGCTEGPFYDGELPPWDEGLENAFAKSGI